MKLDHYPEYSDLLHLIELYDKEQLEPEDLSDDEAEILRSTLPDIRDGMQLVHEDSMMDFMKDRLEEEGGVTPDWIEVDWDRTLRRFSAPFAEIEIGGQTYCVVD